MPKKYTVRWTIDVLAENEKEAAEEALKIQRDPESIATMFQVIELNGLWLDSKHIDLLDQH